MSFASPSLRFAAVGVCALILAGFFFVHRPWLRAGLWRDEAVCVYVGSAPDLSSYLDRYATMDYAPPFFDEVGGVWVERSGSTKRRWRRSPPSSPS